MSQVLTCLSLAALLSGAAYGQPAENRPAFDVADVHETVHSTNQFARGGQLRGGRFELRNATMVDLIGKAYGVDTEKVVGGPSWLEMDRYDVVALAPSGSQPEVLKSMLQTLLGERFKLAAHVETKPMPAFRLTAGKHPSLKKSDGSGDTGCKFTVQGGGPQAAGPMAGGSGPVMPSLVYTCRNTTMEAFANEMHGMVMSQQYLGGNPVVDETELKGSWDFELKYSMRGFIAGVLATDTVTMFDAVEKQLGLKLDPVKVPMSVVVVETVNRKPADNPAEVAERLPALQSPTEFEVADVKPSDPDSRGMRFQIQPGGRVSVQGMTVKFLIEQAWDISDDLLVGAPKWIDTDRYDIIAKAPNSGLAGGQSIDTEAVFVMMRALLADRFKLVSHNEERTVAAYTLLAGKPKLKKADPTSRTRFKEGAQPDAKDPRKTNAPSGRVFTCQNVTMAQFAERLRSIARGYIRSPVQDATGIEGGWDFTLNFSPAGIVHGGGDGGRGRGGDAAPAVAGDTPSAADPSDALTLFEAIDKQLGLKLELQKRPMSVLVIDSIERKPTDN